MHLANANRIAVWALLQSALVSLGCRGELEAPMAAARMDADVQRGGTLEIATSGDLRSLDPHSIGDGLAPSMIDLMFAGLVEYNSKGELEGDLAARYEPLPAAPGFRFFLRENVYFQDGTEVTAENIAASMHRALHPKTPNPSQSLFASIHGFADFSSGKATTLAGLRATGRYVLDIELSNFDATFLAALAQPGARPTCPSMGALYTGSAAPCGAGPFRFASWLRGQEVQLRRYARYFRPGLPYLDGVRFTLGRSYVAQRMQFARGEQHILREFLQPDLLRYQRDPRWQKFGYFESEKQMAAEGMNVEMAPFDNVEIRRAVASAINREEYALIKPSIMRPLSGPVPQGVQGYDPALACQTFDLPAAREHMRKAGYAYDDKTATGGYPKTIVYHTYSQALPEFTAQLLAQQLGRIGLKIEIRLTSYAAWLALSHRRHSTAFSYQGWSMDYSDPNDFLEPLFHSAAINDDDSNNASFYRNPAFDQTLDSAKREPRGDVRKEMLARATRMVCDDAPWAFTYSVRTYVLHQPIVHGLRPHPILNYPVREVWLEHGRDAATSDHAVLPPAKVLPRGEFK
jgi:ABC-type transport system substrate-binding protein